MLKNLTNKYATAVARKPSSRDHIKTSKLKGGAETFTTIGVSPVKNTVTMYAGMADKTAGTNTSFSMSLLYGISSAKSTAVRGALNIALKPAAAPTNISIRMSLSLEVLVWSLLEGFLATAVAYLFVKLFNMVKSAVSRYTLNQLKRALIGGCILSLIWLFMPDAAGLGYNVISKALQGVLNDDPAYAACLLLVKMTATAITLNFGGSGGLFIPSIFLGAMLGVVFNGIFHASASASGLFVVVGMAAVLSATSKTLLTSVLFIAETCTPLSIIPATLASSISYFASGTCSLYEGVQLGKRAVEEEKALEELYHMVIEQNREDALKVKVGDIMNRNPIALQEDMTVKEVIRIAENYNFRVYPVVDERFRLTGFTTIEDILSLPRSKYDLKLSATLLRKPLIAFENEELGGVLRKMIEYEIDHVYVVSDLEQMKLIGVVSGIDVVRFLLKYVK